jgi:uncharacterized membrane protein YbhN (UPF0104 family)
VTRGAWRPRNRLLLVSTLVLAGTLVALAAHQDEARAAWKSLTGVPVATLAIVLLLVFCQLASQALRLWAILPRDVALTPTGTAYAFAVGEWVNIFTPARAGDALKVVLMSRARAAAPPSLSKATGAMLADKIVDAGSLVVLCVAAGMTDLIRAGVRARMPRLGIVVAAGAVVAVLLLGLRWVGPRWLERLTQLRRELTQGLAALKDPTKLLASTCFSFGAWLVELLALRILCGALGYALSPSALRLALGVLNLGISIPVSAANLGVYEGVLAMGLARSGVPLPSAIAIATLHHALQLLGTNLGAAGLSLWVASRRQGGGVSDPLPGGS